MKKLWDLKKGFSNLELEGQRHGIIMGVTCLLLLGQFYTIQTQTDQIFWRGVYRIKILADFQYIYLWTQPYMLLGLDMIFDPFMLQKQAFESRHFEENIEKE